MILLAFIQLSVVQLITICVLIGQTTFDCVTEDEMKNAEWSVICGFGIIKEG